jgi:hypothetical protein
MAGMAATRIANNVLRNFMIFPFRVRRRT